MVEAYTRLLTPQEKRMVRAGIALCNQQMRRGKRVAFVPLLAIPIALAFLWVGQNMNAMVAIGCGAVYLPIFAWATRDARRDSLQRRKRWQAILDDNRVDVLRCVAGEVVEWEEKEDEGKTYFFQIEEDKILVLTGQEYYPTRRFPNDDFELVISEGERPVFGYTRCLGNKLNPQFVLPASSKREWYQPQDREIFEGRVSDLESILRRKGNQTAPQLASV
jgi:hypothetical protein